VEPFVFGLYDGVCDGRALLQMEDKDLSGTVDSKSVNKSAMNKF
jgi:hypothetical protein